jgi:FixJ family two-component response regulator
VLVRTDDASPSRFELGRILISRRIDLPVIFETDLGGDVDLAIWAMKAGAIDVLQTPAEPRMVLAAVASALATLRQVDMIEDAAEGARAQIALMSTREREVLDGLLAGGTNKTIARELGISPRTVEVHRARMMERLGAHTAQEAVMAAAAAGVKPPRGRRDGG